MRRTWMSAFAVLFGLSLVLVGCQGQQGEQQLTNGAKARQLVADGALLLDVRTAGEFNANHIDGAVNIPISNLTRQLDEVKKHDKVVVYCQSGPRAAEATKILLKAGMDVHNLGAMAAWYK